jgi:DNA-binding CsgD family transcriptional regulator
LTGEPGIGKTRLADELTARTRERGVRVFWGRCWARPSSVRVSARPARTSSQGQYEGAPPDSHALQKIGLSSQMELILGTAAAQDPSVPATPPGLERATLGFDDLVVLTYPLPEVDLPTCLSPAEREIALLLVRGHPYRDIATQRSRSTRTIANQVRSLFRKLSVTSRAGLAMRVRRVACTVSRSV